MFDQPLLIAILVMMSVSWLPRMLPLLLVRKRITNPFIRSFLYYIPYAVLATMTIPAIFTATNSVWSAAAGLLVALALGFNGRSLLTVAIGASAAVFVIERLLQFI